MIMRLYLNAHTGRVYEKVIDLSQSGSTLFTHPARDGFQGPFREVQLQYTDLTSEVAGEAFQFFVSSIQIQYMSNLDPKVRKMYSTKLCTDIFERSMIEANNVLDQVTITFRDDQCGENERVFDKEYKAAVDRISKQGVLEQDYNNCLYNCKATNLVKPGGHVSDGFPPHMNGSRPVCYPNELTLDFEEFNSNKS